MSDDVIDFEEYKKSRRRTIATPRRPGTLRIDGELIRYELGGALEDWELTFTPETARKMAASLTRMAYEIDRRARLARGDCLRCWRAKTACICPPPPPIHWPMACHIGKRLAARDARLYHGKLRSPQLAEKPSQVTCKHCKKRMPTIVSPDGADVVA